MGFRVVAMSGVAPTQEWPIGSTRPLDHGWRGAQSVRAGLEDHAEVLGALRLDDLQVQARAVGSGEHVRRALDAVEHRLREALIAV